MPIMRKGYDMVAARSLRSASPHAAFRPTAIAASLAALAVAFLTTFSLPANAMKIQTVKSPGGIEAWLVEEHAVPMMAMRFAFEGGSSQDPAGKEGLANFVTAMLDEGAGDLKSRDFQERMEDLSMRMNYEEAKDAFYGNFETLTENRDEAAKLLKLALTKPRFDEDAVERIRQQLLASLVYAARDPDKVAQNQWYAVAFAGHPYARPANGTEATVGKITGADLESYRKRVFAKDTLKVVAVGDITPEQLGKLLDEVFGDLPAKAELTPVSKTSPVTGGSQTVVDMNVPQSVAVFGMGAMPRKDPDFMPAFVLNQILGGGGFASKLMEEVREKRGLAYSVYTYVYPYQHTSIFSGGVATRNDMMGQSLDIIREELKKMADGDVKQADLDNAKSYLIGSYPLRFDTNAKIASQLLGLRMDGFGPEYVDNRNAMIAAVTLDDLKRVAKRLLDTQNLIVTIVGKPTLQQAKKGLGLAVRLLGALDRLGDEPARFARVADVVDLRPLAGLEILVVPEEVLDLLHRDLRQIGVVRHLVVAHRRLAARHGDDFFVAAALVLHDEHAHRPAVDDGAGHDGARVADEHVDRIAVERQRVRDEPVVPGVAHRRVEKAIDDQRARSLVHLVFDGLAAHRNLDDDVDVEGRVQSDRNRVEPHHSLHKVHCSALAPASTLGQVIPQSGGQIAHIP